MKVLILGCGNIGSVAARALAEDMGSVEVVLADKDEAKAKEVARKIGGENVSWITLDVTNHKALVRTLEEFDLINGFLPAKFGFPLMKACIEAEKNLVDISYMLENPLTLNKEAEKAQVTIVPDCGLAPGISNFIVGHAVKKFDSVKAIRIMIGGVPEKPIPPLDYVVTWSSENLIDEYMRKVRIVKEGKRCEVEALEGLEAVEFPNVGKFEAFYTDGLRTLLYTFPNVYEMWEKTLRYPGHVEKIKLLKALGFFEDEELNVNGVFVSPKKVTAKLLEKKLRLNVRDLVLLKVEIIGSKDDSEMRGSYSLLFSYDAKKDVTAMAKTTAYPASAVAQLILKGRLKEKGVIAPEKIGMNDEFYQFIMNYLDKNGIKVVEETTC